MRDTGSRSTRHHTSAGIVKTLVVWSDAAMSQTLTRPALYKGFRFPPEIIQPGGLAVLPVRGEPPGRVRVAAGPWH